MPSVTHVGLASNSHRHEQKWALRSVLSLPDVNPDFLPDLRLAQHQLYPEQPPPSSHAPRMGAGEAREWDAARVREWEQDQAMGLGPAADLGEEVDGYASRLLYAATFQWF
ncbi:MAG: hypothetical protein M3Z35_07140 [Nitrospirota bacterium]|nr:hypothetical protein [Nitrospirota bacterium]